jgi:hypothetical protein
MKHGEGMNTEIENLLLSPYKAVVIGRRAIISDLHLGIEQSMPGSIPRLQIDEIVARVEKIVNDHSIKELIIAGDMKHEFSRNMPYEWNDVQQFVEKFSDLKIRVVRGNHDNYLSAILSEYDIEVEPYLEVNGWIITHGHSFHDELKNSDRIIIGHEHPSVKLRVSFSIYTYPCFLVCGSKDSDRKLIVLPAFSSMVSGSDILSLESFLSDFTNDFRDDEIEIHAIEERVYHLGDLKRLREILNVF